MSVFALNSRWSAVAWHGKSRWSLGRRPSSSERRRRERTLTPCYDQHCQQAARSGYRSALGMCRVRSSPACRTERMRSLEQPGPKGNAQITSPGRAASQSTAAAVQPAKSVDSNHHFRRITAVTRRHQTDVVFLPYDYRAGVELNQLTAKLRFSLTLVYCRRDEHEGLQD